MAVSKDNGNPKWMVKTMENPIKMDDLGGKTTPIFGNTRIYTWMLWILGWPIFKGYVSFREGIPVP